MTNQNTATQLMEIAARIREMREILGYSEQTMAEMTEVTVDTYRQYESGTIDLPFTFIHKAAKAFGVEITWKATAPSCPATPLPARARA